MDDEDSKQLVEYLTGRAGFNLSQMLWTLNKAREPRTPLHSAFAKWLNGKNHMLLQRFATVDTPTITKFRNRPASRPPPSLLSIRIQTEIDSNLDHNLSISSIPLKTNQLPIQPPSNPPPLM